MQIERVLEDSKRDARQAHDEAATAASSFVVSKFVRL